LTKQKVKVWIFTFGYGHAYPGGYVKIKGTFNNARTKMFKWFGNKWAFQYPYVEKGKDIIKKWNLREVGGKV
jgi:hypothetical protein